MANRRYGHACAELDGVVYVLGGRSQTDAWLNMIETFDLRAGRWSVATGIPMPCGRVFHSAVMMRE
jgi:hypothetical protein